DLFFCSGKIKNIAGTNWFKAALIVFLILLVGNTVKKNRYFIFTLDRIEQADKAGAVLDSLPDDGVLAEGFLTDALVYNCKKRIVTLPRSPDPVAARQQTDLSIEVFDLHYVVVSEFWKIEVGILPNPAVEYIKNSPDKFKLIKTVYEYYDKGIRSNIMIRDDMFYIYEVIKDKIEQ
ncbi:MAG: hypothetical protein KKH29_06325, partial [Candidatus Omnitrophica bacterium]|nr:hypothetical protein [Candidatus Omnitrophota bacterium]